MRMREPRACPIPSRALEQNFSIARERLGSWQTGASVRARIDPPFRRGALRDARAAVDRHGDRRSPKSTKARGPAASTDPLLAPNSELPTSILTLEGSLPYENTTAARKWSQGAKTLRPVAFGRDNRRRHVDSSGGNLCPRCQDCSRPSQLRLCLSPLPADQHTPGISSGL
jgi:hypothetical protein